jgi:Flp pilus assembly protein TadG
MECRSRRRAHRERGSSLVEFALVAPLLFMLLFGIFEIGRALYVQQALIFSAREGARLAAIEGVDAGPIEARVREVLGPIDATGITISGPDAQRMVRVTVESEVRILRGSALLGPLAGDITLRGESAVRFEN